MRKDPNLRLQSLEFLKEEEWLKDVDWEEFGKKKVDPPYIPEFKTNKLYEYFDEEYTKCYL